MRHGATRGSGQLAPCVVACLSLLMFAGGCGSSSAGGDRAISGASSARVHYLANVRVDCEAARGRVTSVLPPSGGAFAGRRLIAYERRLLTIARSTLSQIREVGVPSGLADVEEAFATEMRGTTIIEREIGAQQRGDRAEYRRLVRSAQILTHPADRTLRRYGLAVCVHG